MVVLVTAAILFSFAMACGMPFAALGALAALAMVPRDAVLLAGLGWLANQAIGFGILGYPLDATTIAWGGVLGLSALAGVGMALLALRMTRSAGLAVRLVLALVAAWAGQQGIVVAAGAGLLASASAAAPAVLLVHALDECAGRRRPSRHPVDRRTCGAGAAGQPRGPSLKSA